MLTYARTRLETFFRTKSSLMIVLRRRLREAVREEKSLKEVLLPQLKEAVRAGDVDATEEDLKKFEELWGRILSRIDKAEEYALSAEARPLQPVAEIAFFLHKLVDRLHKIFQTTSDKAVRTRLSKLVEEILKAKERLAKLFSEENEDLHKEYLALLRQAEEKRGTLQNFVVAYNEIMQLMDQAWDERSKTRKVTHEAESIEDALHRTLINLESYVGTGKPTIDLIDKECTKIEQDVKQVVQETEAMLHGFLFMLKAMSDLYLTYDESNEEVETHFFKTLEETGFPQDDLKELETASRESKEKRHDQAEFVVNAFRRMARLEAARVREAQAELAKAA